MCSSPPQTAGTRLPQARLVPYSGAQGACFQILVSPEHTPWAGGYGGVVVLRSEELP